MWKAGKQVCKRLMNGCERERVSGCERASERQRGCSAKQMSEAANINLRLRELPQLAKRPFVQRVLWWPQKRKSCDASRGSDVAALMENRLKGGQMRWPSLPELLELRLLQAELRNYSWVHNLISNWPTGATQLPATVATRRQQAACNTIR